MPRPFPLPFTVGNDICSVPRILSILQSARAVRFTKKILNERERFHFAHILTGAHECDRVHKSPKTPGIAKLTKLDIHGAAGPLGRKETQHQIPSIHALATFLAGRFAAKEAAIKAHRQRRLTFHDISIIPQRLKDGKTQAPEAIVVAVDGSWEDGQIVPLSISHDGGFAIATCLAAEE